MVVRELVLALAAASGMCRRRHCPRCAHVPAQAVVTTTERNVPPETAALMPTAAPKQPQTIKVAADAAYIGNCNLRNITAPAADTQRRSAENRICRMAPSRCDRRLHPAACKQNRKTALQSFGERESKAAKKYYLLTRGLRPDWQSTRRPPDADGAARLQAEVFSSTDMSPKKMIDFSFRCLAAKRLCEAF